MTYQVKSIEKLWGNFQKFRFGKVYKHGVN